MNSAESDPQPVAPPGGRGWISFLLAGLSIASIAFLFLPLGKWLESYRSFLVELGWVGWLLYIAAYIVFSILLLPVSPLTLLAGSGFGLWNGFWLTVVASNLGALCPFLLARSVLRARVEKWVREHPRFSAVEGAISRRGFYITMLLRLSPIFPFTLLNYFIGLTRIPVLHYVCATLAGMLPGTFVIIYFASLSSTLARGEASWMRAALYVAGFLATVAVTVVVTRIARKALREAETVPAHAAGK